MRADVTENSLTDTAYRQRTQQALQDCSAALKVYSVHSSNDTEHQQTALSNSSGGSSDSMKHMPSCASTIVAIEKWLAANTSSTAQYCVQKTAYI